MHAMFSPWPLHGAMSGLSVPWWSTSKPRPEVWKPQKPKPKGREWSSILRDGEPKRSIAQTDACLRQDFSHLRVSDAVRRTGELRADVSADAARSDSVRKPFEAMERAYDRAFYKAMSGRRKGGLFDAAWWDGARGVAHHPSGCHWAYEQAAITAPERLSPSAYRLLAFQTHMHTYLQQCKRVNELITKIGSIARRADELQRQGVALDAAEITLLVQHRDALLTEIRQSQAMMSEAIGLARDVVVADTKHTNKRTAAQMVGDGVAAVTRGVVIVAEASSFWGVVASLGIGLTKVLGMRVFERDRCWKRVADLADKANDHYWAMNQEVEHMLKYSSNAIETLRFDFSVQQFGLIQQRFDAIDTRFDANEQRLDSAQQQLAMGELRDDKMSSDIQGLSAKVGSLDQKFDALGGRVGEIAGEVSSLRRQHEPVERNVGLLREGLDEVVRTTCDLREGQRELVEGQASLRRTLHAWTQRVPVLARANHREQLDPDASSMHVRSQQMPAANAEGSDNARRAIDQAQFSQQDFLTRPEARHAFAGAFEGARANRDELPELMQRSLLLRRLSTPNLVMSKP